MNNQREVHRAFSIWMLVTCAESTHVQSVVSHLNPLFKVCVTVESAKKFREYAGSTFYSRFGGRLAEFNPTIKKHLELYYIHNRRFLTKIQIN